MTPSCALCSSTGALLVSSVWSLNLFGKRHGLGARYADRRRVVAGPLAWFFSTSTCCLPALLDSAVDSLVPAAGSPWHLLSFPSLSPSTRSIRRTDLTRRRQAARRRMLHDIHQRASARSHLLHAGHRMQLRYSRYVGSCAENSVPAGAERSMSKLYLGDERIRGTQARCVEVPNHSGPQRWDFGRAARAISRAQRRVRGRRATDPGIASEGSRSVLAQPAASPRTSGFCQQDEHARAQHAVQKDPSGLS